MPALQKGYGPRALAARAAAAVESLVTAAASKVAPSYFKTSRSAATLAYNNTVDYAEPGLAEHKVRLQCRIEDSSIESRTVQGNRAAV